MIIPDVNLLICAHVQSMPQHAAARQWWESLLNGEEPVGLAWSVVVGFIRLTTSRQVFARPLTPDQAFAITDEWMTRPMVQFIEPGTQHYALFRRLLAATAGGNLTTDAHLAALAIEHNAELHSNDADFARFSGTRWVNPLGQA
jgi:uncharacterized protein